MCQSSHPRKARQQALPIKTASKILDTQQHTDVTMHMPTCAASKTRVAQQLIQLPHARAKPPLRQQLHGSAVRKLRTAAKNTATHAQGYDSVKTARHMTWS
jgi:hypothetical protein